MANYTITFTMRGIECVTKPIKSETEMLQSRERLLGANNVEDVEVKEHT